MIMQFQTPKAARGVHEIKKGYEEYRWVGTNQRKIKIYYKDIVCIQKIKGSKYAEYITENGKYMERLSMNQILEQIHSNAFILVDRGHAVNVNHIVRVRGNVIQMVIGKTIPMTWCGWQRRKMKHLRKNWSESMMEI